MVLVPTGNESGAPQFWHGNSPPAMSSLRPQDSQMTCCAPGTVFSSSPQLPHFLVCASMTCTGEYSPFRPKKASKRSALALGTFGSQFWQKTVYSILSQTDTGAPSGSSDMTPLACTTW